MNFPLSSSLQKFSLHQDQTQSPHHFISVLYFFIFIPLPIAYFNIQCKATLSSYVLNSSEVVYLIICLFLSK